MPIARETIGGNQLVIATTQLIEVKNIKDTGRDRGSEGIELITMQNTTEIVETYHLNLTLVCDIIHIMPISHSFTIFPII